MNKYKKREWVCRLLSWAITFGLLIVLILVGVGRYSNPSTTVNSDFEARFGTEATQILGKLKTVALSALISVIPMALLALIAKDKVKPLVWAGNIILSNILFGSTVMYIVFAFWVLNEYALTPLQNNAHTASIAYKVVNDK